MSWWGVREGMDPVTGVDPPEWVTLDGEETMQLWATPSNNLLLGVLALSGVLIVVMGLVLSLAVDLATGRVLAAAMIALVFALLALAYLTMQRYEYVVTDHRAYERRGLLSKTVRQIPLRQVRAVKVEQSAWQGWVGIGHLLLTSDTGDDMRLAFVENPAAVRDTVSSVADAAGGRAS
ncbi:hypothetical protein BRC90_06360 [Halobacteriales archaeon QS_4_69_34]|nr:MAG: hypothetical protein BRC90_06360 [Halobacteriales archaeon QS_4_69_34]